MKTSLEHHSAGGLVVRADEVLLISPASNRWQLPKGHVEQGESTREAAVREVREETGIYGEIVAELPAIEYRYRARNHRWVEKQVDYYLMLYVGGSVADFDPLEVDVARWFPWGEARRRLTYANERELLDTAARSLDRPAAADSAAADALPATPTFAEES